MECLFPIYLVPGIHDAVVRSDDEVQPLQVPIFGSFQYNIDHRLLKNETNLIIEGYAIIF